MAVVALSRIANVQVSIAGIEFELRGVQLRLTSDHRLLCQSPTFRHPTSGKWLPAVVLPPELSKGLVSKFVARESWHNGFSPHISHRTRSVQSLSRNTRCSPIWVNASPR